MKSGEVLSGRGTTLKPATMLGTLFVLVALVLYSIAVWGAFRRRAFTQRDLVLLVVGLVFDVAATASMSSTIGWTLDLRAGLPTAHTVLALLAMLGMLVGTVAGYMAFRKTDAKAMLRVTRWIVAPWALWAFIFVWGGSRIGLK
jgi:hypothetical protein